MNGLNPISASSDAVATERSPLLSVESLSKNFGNFRALDQMMFNLRAGEVHVLFGENGAGKSTLINIICGALDPSGGSLVLDGRPITLSSVKDARDRGIAAVFQEFSLAPDLTIEENLFLGSELVSGIRLRRAEMRLRARETLEDLGFRLDPRRRVSSLSRAECQMVEIAKAIVTDPRVLIFDEPTASLTEAETAALFSLIAGLKARGVGMIYITHRIEEIVRIGDRVTVMRDGRFIETLDARTATRTELVESMTGRKFGDFYPKVNFAPGEEVLSIDGLATSDGRVRDAGLTIQRGEIVGLAGLVGCGKSEIGRACFGLEPLEAGTIRFCGETMRHLDPRQLIERGLIYVPSDRIREGLLLGRSTRENLSLSSLESRRFNVGGFLRRKEERGFAHDMGQRLGVRPLRVEGAVADYSGGNKQKVLLGRAIAMPLKLLILDEPTVGIDVGAKAEVYALLAELVQQGVAILIISSDLPEVLSLSHRVYVVSGGRVTDELTGERRTESAALGKFFAN